jgi:choline kinase
LEWKTGYARLENINITSSGEQIKMKVIILAGGLGTRVGQQVEAIPKPMVLIGNIPVLWQIMKIYSHHGFNECL